PRNRCRKNNMSIFTAGSIDHLWAGVNGGSGLMFLVCWRDGRGRWIRYFGMSRLGVRMHSNNIKVSKGGAVLESYIGRVEDEELSQFIFSAFNIQANVDSRLVANQVNGTHVAKEADMIRYMEKVRTLTSSIKAFLIRQVSKSENKKADTLSKIASTSFAHLRPLQANYVLREIHEGSCSMHADTSSVVAKALRIGYYWPTMHKHAMTLIRACQDCQVHKPVLRNPQQKLTPITSLWPFYKWGIDIAGPFLEGPGKVKFLIVAMDYFTKWIEAKPVATITGNQIKKFVWDNIVCRFGLPGEIISDIERAHHSLGEGIKVRLLARSKNWIEELSHVLWAHRTMIKSSNGDTLFSLTYETEAVIPTEIGIPTLRTTKVDLVQNNKALEINLDLLEDRREQAAIREAKST
nr:reverse transcriptase domain-containing protein [Tanacetum cinerariifolium]